ncbi:MAG: glycosyltransferase [Armatimonadetes bacterium]|nr:glycosyltransferase [Armatimonadota bacterium]
MPTATLTNSHHSPAISGRARRNRRALVMCASIPWSFHRNRQQELAARLSAVMPVVYVEPPVAGRARRSTQSTPLRAVGDDCHVLSTGDGLPGDRFASRINSLVQRRLGRSISRALARLQYECSVLWVDRIQSAALLSSFADALIVYDCVDEEWTFGRFGRESHLRRLEQTLAGRADITIASSNRLCRRLSGFTANVECVPNGCDFAHFSRPIANLDLPPDTTSIGSPRIGFVGGIARRSVDHELVRFAASRLPECHFVFVGAADAHSAHAFAGLDNVALLGARDYRDLPAYLAAFDVTMIPYLAGGEIDYVYPKKLHEYLAAGKPVVATDLPELRPFEGIIRIGRSGDEFVRAIEDCLSENADPVLSERLRAERRAVAREHTWQDRAAQIVALLDKGLQKRGLPAMVEARAEDYA